MRAGLVADLDAACRLALGNPIGPFAMMDIVTSDPCLQVQEILQDAYGERFRPPALLKQSVAAGYGGGRGRPGWLGKNREALERNEAMSEAKGPRHRGRCRP